MEFHLKIIRSVIPVKPYLAILTLFLYSSLAIAEDEGTKIAVIYPQVREPYIRIFKEIIAGITETIPYSVEQYGMAKEEGFKQIQNRLKGKNIDSIILLGSRALKLSPELSKEKTILTGAVFSSPSSRPLNSSSISMIVSPEVLLKKLLLLAPSVKTVHVIYNKHTDSWIIAQAENMLKNRGLTLNALASNDVRGNARLYNSLFRSKSLSNADAVWLLQNDPSLKEPRIFATILENAWAQRFVVFSANPTHVRKGALFAMYPDNKQLGISLAHKMLSLRNDNEGHSITPLRDLLVAVNIRTAEHLDIDFSRSERKSFNMIFPSR